MLEGYTLTHVYPTLMKLRVSRLVVGMRLFHVLRDLQGYCATKVMPAASKLT